MHIEEIIEEVHTLRDREDWYKRQLNKKDEEIKLLRYEIKLLNRLLEFKDEEV